MSAQLTKEFVAGSGRKSAEVSICGGGQRFHQQAPRMIDQIGNFKGFYQVWERLFLKKPADIWFGQTRESEQQMLF
jgi:hypothetical protein